MGAAPGTDNRGATTDPSVALDAALAGHNALGGAPVHTLVLGNTAFIALSGPEGSAGTQGTAPGPGGATTPPAGQAPGQGAGAEPGPDVAGAPDAGLPSGMAGAAMEPIPGAMLAGTLDSAALSDRVVAALPWVREIRIATEPRAADRLAEISAEVRAGRPVTDFLDELSDLAAAMTRVPVAPAAPGAAPGAGGAPPEGPAGAPGGPAGPSGGPAGAPGATTP